MSSSELTPRAEPDELESQLLKSLLAARDIACPVCGYNLRAIVSPNCPECGAKLDLRIGSGDLKLGAWLVALLALAVGLGFTSIVGVIVAAGQTIYGGPWDYVLPVLYVLAVASAVFGVGLWGLIARRRKFWKRRPEVQRYIAVGYLIGSCAAIGLTVYLLFLVG